MSELVKRVDEEPLSVDEKWERLKRVAPEVWEFHEAIVNGEYQYWWQDKPFQLMNRSLLYSGLLAAQLAAKDAENARLREALEFWQSAVRIDALMEGPRYMGVSSTIGKRAWENATEVLAILKEDTNG